MIVTGVARARDKLDSATSTSSLTDSDIVKIAPTSLSDLFRNIPGIRSEASSGEGNGSYTIRGLPLVSTGAKYLQFQEDGLPVLEFGDITGLTSDVFLRADFNIAQVESIRGGSASTFASNAPGGVINLISHTGEVEGGSVQASAGLDYKSYRTDFDYGGRLSDTMRFHIGGFYRAGDGARHVGYTADQGGQVKLNITKEFTGGHVRLYGKLLDDHNATYNSLPVAVTGTDDNPNYSDLPNFSVSNDSLLSRSISNLPKINGNNDLTQVNLQDGTHALAKSLGFEVKATVGDWSVSNNMRYANQSASSSLILPLGLIPAGAAGAIFGTPGSRLVYASGPQKGQTIANSAALNGNGMLALSAVISSKVRSVDNFTDDLRVSRVWGMGEGALTTTAGVYLARQDIKVDRALIDVLQDVRGDGRSALVDIIGPNGVAYTQDGVVDFTGPGLGTHSSYDVEYGVLAPYASLNFRTGKLSVGGSVRVDTGTVQGTVRTNGAADTRTIDVDNDGIITNAERTFAIAPYSNNLPVDYDYHYVSYSGSVNYRVSQSFSAFGRHSRGARGGADRILLSPAISSVDGSLASKSAAYDPVKQTELGMKFRHGGLFLNATGFYATVRETNTQLQPDANGITSLVLVNRAYRAFGGEFEGGIRRGPLNLTGSATLTNAKITAAEDRALIGNTPRHQAKLIFQLMPQYETELFTVGADVIGTTRSFTQDTNQLRMPGYATVNAFVQVRPIDRVVLSLNVNNVFDTRALIDVSAGTIPTSGYTLAQTLYGRTITTALRVFF